MGLMETACRDLRQAYGARAPSGVGTAILSAILLAAHCAFAADYLSPSALLADSAGQTIYIAEVTARQVAVWDVATGKVCRHIALPEAPGGLALSPDGSVLCVSGNAPHGRVHFVNVTDGKLMGAAAVGHSPGAMAVAPRGDKLYVCNRFDNSVSAVSLATREETARIPVLREPVSIAVTPGDGRYIVVGNSLPAGPATGDRVAAAISIIDTSQERVVANVALHNGSTDLHGVCLSPDEHYAYAVHTLSRYAVAATQLDRGWMNTSALSIIDVPQQRLVDTVLLDELNHGAANPWGVTCTADGKHLCITHSGTHEISVIDRLALHTKLDARRTTSTTSTLSTMSTLSTASTPAVAAPDDLAFLAGIRQRIPLRGKGPRGLAVIGTTAYAAEYFTDTLGVVNMEGGSPPNPRSLPLGPGRPLTAARRGEMMFHDAERCYQSWQSCASCHPDGRADGLNWDLLNDGIGNPKNNRSLVNAHKRQPVMSLGARENSQQAVHAGFKAIQFATITDEENACVLEYLKGLKPVSSPHLVDGRLSEAAQRGRKVFASARCGECHNGRHYTDLRGYDLGYGKGLDTKKLFITPPLDEVWRTAPYLHDGRAATMHEVFTRYNADDRHGVTSNLTKEQLDDLVEYVMSL